jgi:hypothetical protein
MDDTLALSFDPAVRADIAAELGSMNKFYDRLDQLVLRESGGRASLSENSKIEASGAARGGEVIEVITAMSGLIAALSPIVIAWIRSRSFEVDETVETLQSGAVVHTLRVHSGISK